MRIGHIQELRVNRETQHGLYLGDEDGEVLLPRGQCPVDARIGDALEVFVYTDSEDRPVATTKRPYATVGECARLRVVSVTNVGAFLDWGLDKDLFCPNREQAGRMRVGEEYVVCVYLDQVSKRVACSNRLNRHLSLDGSELRVGDKVEIMVSEQLWDSTIVIIDGWLKASMFPDEWHEDLEPGDVRPAYVKQVREDGRVAVSLRPQGYEAVLGERERILEALKREGGVLPVSDKSSPEEIQRRFGLSKGAFKKLIGTMYREGEITIGSDSIRLT
ncbi:MAG TPA: S1-like domain-containing RNA-binding protein [Fimbriimonas sp.]|nr:S1-like domain-containing RNA-binding protein [Fimbriimonas sp.]